MKKIILFLTITILVIFGCKKEEITPLAIADFSVHVAGQNKNTAGKVAINDYLTFFDVSRNATAHEWRIDEGNFFINAEFSNEDSIYTDFIIAGAGNVSAEQKVNVLFTEVGLQPIQIYNTFDKEPADGPATATLQGGLWVIDTTYMIDVFDNLQPAFKVFKGTDEVLNVAAGDIPNPNDSETWPIVEVEAGESLTYVDVTTIGRPNKRTWSFEGSVPATATDSAVTVTYFSLGTFVGGRFNSERSGEFPEQNAAKVLPIQVKVLPSTLPFLYDGNLEEQADELITFNVGGELEPFSGQEGMFKVQVKNDSAGFDQEIPVELAKVSDDDATKIELKLSAPIYNSDLITVSYAGTEIKSQDFRTLSDFDSKTVTMHFDDNLLPTDWAGFETADANWKKAFCLGFWVGNSNGDEMMPHYTRTEEKFANGISCMKLDLFNGVENKVLQGADFSTFGLTAGDYLLKFKLYLEPGNILTTLETIVKDPNTVITWDITNTPRGEWVELSQKASFASDPTSRYDFKINAAANPASTDSQILYIDDYEFLTLEKR